LYIDFLIKTPENTNNIMNTVTSKRNQDEMFLEQLSGFSATLALIQPYCFVKR